MVTYAPNQERGCMKCMIQYNIHENAKLTYMKIEFWPILEIRGTLPGECPCKILFWSLFCLNATYFLEYSNLGEWCR